MPADVVTVLEGAQLKASIEPGDRAYHIEILEQNGIYDENIWFKTKQVGDKGCLLDKVLVQKRQTISEIGKNNSPEDIRKRILIDQDWHAYFPCEATK